MGRWRFLWLGLGWTMLVATRVSAQTSAASVSTTEQLPAGQQSGTFAFRYSAKVKFVQDEAFPVHVILFTDGQTPVADVVVQNNAPFIISTDLPPGGYHMQSEVMPGNASLYWSAAGPSFFINSAGGIRYLQSENSLIHTRKIDVLTSNPQHLGSTRRSEMTLRWAPLRGAVRYHISWSEQMLPRHEKVSSGSDDTTDEAYPFPEEVRRDRRYEFSIYAYDNAGRMIGYSVPVYFYTAGSQQVSEPKIAAKKSEPEKLKEKSAPEPEKPTAPKGVPFFGVRPVPVAAAGEGMPGGLRVDGVGFNSPASKAGLRRDDVITNFNGVSITPTTTPEQLAALVQSIPPGSKILVEFYRKNEKLVVEVTILAKK